MDRDRGLWGSLPFSKGTKIIVAAVAGVVLGLWLSWPTPELASSSYDDAFHAFENKTQGPLETPVKPEGPVKNAQATTLEMSAAVFIGNHSKEQLKRSFDSILAQFQQVPSEAHYKTLANVLVRMRKESDGRFTETEVMECMRSTGSSFGNKYVDAAGICAGMLSAHRK